MRLPEHLFRRKRQKTEADPDIARLETRLTQITVSPPSSDRFLEGMWAKVDREAALRERAHRPYVLRPAFPFLVVAGIGLAVLLFYLPRLRSIPTVHVDPKVDRSVRLTPPISPLAGGNGTELAALFPDLWNLSGGQITVPESHPGNHKTRHSTKPHRAHRSRSMQLASTARRQNRDRTQASLAWKQITSLVRSVPARLYPDVGLVRAAWQRQAVRLEMEGRYAEASTAYGCAFRLRRDPGAAFAAGRMAEAAGNIENAVAYYATLLN